MGLVVYMGVTRLIEMHLEEEKVTPLRFQRDVWTEAPTAFAGRTPRRVPRVIVTRIPKSFPQRGASSCALGHERNWQLS